MQIGKMLVVKNPDHHHPQIQSGLFCGRGRGFVGDKTVRAVGLIIWGCGGEMKRAVQRNMVDLMLAGYMKESVLKTGVGVRSIT